MARRNGCKSNEVKIKGKCYSKKPSRIALTRAELAKPLKVICGKCSGEAWVMPFPEPTGTCLCSKCTFGKKGMSLNDMLKKIFIKKK